MDTIIVAGATGDLGTRITSAAVARGAKVRALVRPGTARDRIAPLEAIGADPWPVDFGDARALAHACRGVVCVVSALNGLGETILDTQTKLLDAALGGGAARFIPSDFSIDYRALPTGTNRNFDLRRAFRTRIDTAPIMATSVFNGAFADMLAGQMPLIQRRVRRVLYWGSADTKFALTTKDDVAAYTAAAALDPAAPRNLHIAGAQVSARDLAALMGEVTGRPYGLLRAGSLATLERMIAVTRRLFPAKDQVFPAWQGMQYLHNMFDGRAPSAPVDNARYDVAWTDLRRVLDQPIR
ncbi:NmrA family NAD(P)-binding protein [Sphingomonas hankookensis]|uniref:NmrA family protein n=1 Tax=Sphingomonas hengshuiensis TaxID=1609977 RepID=A0A2W4YVB3_9SPHN|nr:MAG: NmrA family protein [Sphingomonas hengshuiensis]